MRATVAKLFCAADLSFRFDSVPDARHSSYKTNKYFERVLTNHFRYDKIYCVNAMTERDPR